MIEVIYKDEKQEAKGNEGVFSVPRNIRQIGLISEDFRIYVEDYVYTFLGRYAEPKRENGNERGRLAVLTGETKWCEGITYVFIRGALAVEDAEATAEHIGFSEEIWVKIHEEEEKYFSGQEIVGWFFSQPELPVQANEVFQRTHLKYFGGGEKVLMLLDPVEREDAFFRYENGHLTRQEGYYLFYEKNPLMQAYMQEKNQGMSTETKEEVEDDAVKAFRKIIRGKKKEEVEETEAKTSVFSYAATACLVLAVLAVGTNFYRNYRELERVDRQAEAVSSVITEEGGEKADVSPTVIASVTPEVTSIPSEKAKKASAASEKTAGKKAEADRNAEKKQQTEKDAASTAQEEEIQKSEEKSAVYREESDDRKAKRKEDAAAKQQRSAAAQQENLQETSGQNTNTGEKEVSGTGVRSSYVIRPGDTLYQISMEKYGNMDAISEICRLNGLSAEEIIYPGQIIVLP